MTQNNNTLLPSINYHLWQPCNMSCKFCFGVFKDVKKNILPKGHLPLEKSLRLIELIVKAGFSKITFAGGEPTLCPFLPQLVKHASEGGLTTMVVTNGSRLSESYLELFGNDLDWITLSIDSLEPETNLRSGRIGSRIVPDEDFYKTQASLVKSRGHRLKINTVVSKLNVNEDISKFIISAGPDRWKIFQVLPVAGQNDHEFTRLQITDHEFTSFIERHEHVAAPGLFNINMVVEPNQLMIGSYLMIDPAGRFYDNIDDKYFYSSPILDVGIQEAYSQVRIDHNKFIERHGLYDWEMKEYSF